MRFLSWWACIAIVPSVRGIVVTCSDVSDCTADIAAALSSCAEEVVVPAQPTSTWIVRPLFVVCDNQKIVLEPGVTLLAKKNEFHGKSDCLLTVQNVSGITIIADSAALRMRRSDYANASQYDHAQGRHTLAIRGATDVFVRGLTATESGGDGVYVANRLGNSSHPSKNITLQAVTLTKNYRQGMSVISVQGLNVTDSVLSFTNGTPPMAGVDFEPNSHLNVLTGIRFRNVTATGNKGRGFQFSLTKMYPNSSALDAVFENCAVNTTGLYGVSFTGSSTGLLPAGGQLRFTNMTVTGTNGSGLLIENKNGGPLLEMQQSTFNNVARTANAPIWIEGQTRNCTGASFEGVTVADDSHRPAVKFMGAVSGMSGQIDVTNTSPSGCISSPAPPGNSLTVHCSKRAAAKARADGPNEARRVTRAPNGNVTVTNAAATACPPGKCLDQTKPCLDVANGVCYELNCDDVCDSWTQNCVCPETCADSKPCLRKGGGRVCLHLVGGICPANSSLCSWN
jgi:hypothetical protein